MELVTKNFSFDCQMLSKTNKCYRIRYKGIKLLYRNTNIIINVTINHYRIIIYCLTERSFVKLGLSCLPAHWRMYDPCSLVTQNFGQSFQRSIRICLLFPTTAMHQINYSLPASGQCACVCPVNVASLMMNYFVTYPLTTFSRARQIKTSIPKCFSKMKLHEFEFNLMSIISHFSSILYKH